MVIVRPATEEDAPQIVALLNKIIATGAFTAMAEEISLEDQRAFIRGFPSRGIFHAAVTSDSQILGIQDVVPLTTASGVNVNVGEISTFVREDVQGNGIGRVLSQATFQSAFSNGFRKIIATVRRDNLRAIAFYVSQGFMPIGRQEWHARILSGADEVLLLERLLDRDSVPSGT